MVGRAPWSGLLMLLWAGLYASSMIVPALTAPTGDGFVRGYNRLGLLLLFQLAAAVPAVLLLPHARQHNGVGKWLLGLPALLAALPLVALIALFGYAFISRALASLAS